MEIKQVEKLIEQTFNALPDVMGHCRQFASAINKSGAYRSKGQGIDHNWDFNRSSMNQKSLLPEWFNYKGII